MNVASARAAARRTLTDILPGYLESLDSDGKAAHTVASTRLDLQQLARFLGQQTVGTVTPDDLRAFFAWLGREHSNRTSSLRRKTATVKGLFRHLHARGVLEHDPSAELLYPALVITEAAPLTIAEVDAIIAVATSISWRALTLCLTDAGLKRDEVVALRREDIELSEPPIGADGPGRLHVLHRRATKRVKQRTLALTQRLADALAAQLTVGDDASVETVFDISARGIDFIVATCGRRAGVRIDTKITPKQLRDAFACARVRAFQAREAEAADDSPGGQRMLRREHDALLIVELGLARASIVPERYRRMLGRLEGDRTEQG